MLIRQGVDRSEPLDRRLACTLAAIAGAVNTAAFHAVGFFSANMTGNVSALSDHLASGEFIRGAFYLLIVVVFIVGAALCSVLVNAGQRRHAVGVYAWIILLEGLLMAALGIAQWYLAPTHAGPLLILGLSFLMGLQNAVVTRISHARVRTTHVSGMSTDMGIELGRWFDALYRRDASGLSDVNRSKLRLHAQTVSSFLLGGVVGVLLYRSFGVRLLWLAAAALGLLAWPGIRQGYLAGRNLARTE